MRTQLEKLTEVLKYENSEFKKIQEQLHQSQKMVDLKSEVLEKKQLQTRDSIYHIIEQALSLESVLQTHLNNYYAPHLTKSNPVGSQVNTTTKANQTGVSFFVTAGSSKQTGSEFQVKQSNGATSSAETKKVVNAQIELDRTIL